MNNTHNMVERAKPQGRSLCCHEAEGRHEPISHDTPCQRYDNWTVANTTRNLDGGTSRTDWTRKHQKTTKGGGKGGKPGESGPTASTQATRANKKGEDNHTKTTQQQQRKRGAPQRQGRKPHEKRTGNGQPKQGHPRQARDARPRGTDPNTPHKTMQKRIGRMSIPAQSADRHTHAQCSNLKLEAKS